MPKTNKERFYSHVEKTSECWNFTGALNNGYGRFSMSSKSYYAHRVSMFFEGKCNLNPKADKSDYADHLCRNRKCVNPDHIEIIDTRTNIQRGEGISVKNSKKTHCKYGHEFTKENIYIIPSQPRTRVCKVCMKRKNDAREWKKTK